MGAGAQGLSGVWLHSFEEDTATENVFRPATYPFPPSRRARLRLDFGANEMMSAVPGPDDRLQRSTGTITALGMNRFRLGDGREMEVVEAGSDLLKVKMG